VKVFAPLVAPEGTTLPHCESRCASSRRSRSCGRRAGQADFADQFGCAIHGDERQGHGVVGCNVPAAVAVHALEAPGANGGRARIAPKAKTYPGHESRIAAGMSSISWRRRLRAKRDRQRCYTRFERRGAISAKGPGGQKSAVRGANVCVSRKSLDKVSSKLRSDPNQR